MLVLCIMLIFLFFYFFLCYSTVLVGAGCCRSGGGHYCHCSYHLVYELHAVAVSHCEVKFGVVCWYELSKPWHYSRYWHVLLHLFFVYYFPHLLSGLMQNTKRNATGLPNNKYVMFDLINLVIVISLQLSVFSILCIFRIVSCCSFNLIMLSTVNYRDCLMIW